MLTLEVDGVDIVRISGFGDVAELVKRLPQELQGMELQEVAEHPYRGLVEAYFTGDLAALDKIPRHQDGTAFQEKIWQALGDMKRFLLQHEGALPRR